jgi:hypothetical protein
VVSQNLMTFAIYAALQSSQFCRPKETRINSQFGQNWLNAENCLVNESSIFSIFTFSGLSIIKRDKKWKNPLTRMFQAVVRRWNASTSVAWLDAFFQRYLLQIYKNATKHQVTSQLGDQPEVTWFCLFCFPELQENVWYVVRKWVKKGLLKILIVMITCEHVSSFVRSP